jgi:two-component system NarL family response regulator
MNILIVEDHKLTRQNISLLLDGEPSTQRIESFENCERAIDEASWHDTDILLTDLDLPGMDGTELISWTQVKHPHISCMAFTVSDDSDTVFSAIKAGACGYLLKGTSPRELIEALQSIYKGGAPMSPKIARKVIQHFQDQAPTQNLLTAREKEVLRCLERGFSYKQTASELGISPHTVHAYIKSSYEKTNATCRDELLHKARRLGWI